MTNRHANCLREQCERREALVRYAQLLKEHREEIFWLEAILTGKAKSFSMYEVDAAAETFICEFTDIYALVSYGKILTQIRLCELNRHIPWTAC